MSVEESSILAILHNIYQHSTLKLCFELVIENVKSCIVIIEYVCVTQQSPIYSMFKAYFGMFSNKV